jgi:hypothetical protein
VRLVFFVAGAVALAGCAGRDPEPIPTVQSYDSQTTCTQVKAEIEANNVRVKTLADEQGWKAVQNVVAGAGGIFTLGLSWFALDFKGAAYREATALQARQQYLTVLAQERCAPQAQAEAEAQVPSPPSRPARRSSKPAS